MGALFWRWFGTGLAPVRKMFFGRRREWSISALPVAALQGAVAQKDPQTQTVYITRSGKKYHRDGCRYLAPSKSAISLKDAKANGYSACKVCHPPA
jgi:hypothetical protein